MARRRLYRHRPHDPRWPCDRQPHAPVYPALVPASLQLAQFRLRFTLRFTLAAFFFAAPCLRRGGAPRLDPEPRGRALPSIDTRSSPIPPVTGAASARRTVTRVPNPITRPLSAPVNVALSASK